ncbi:OmpA family protein [Pseudomonas delhiensis]|uniref:OmpA family protein n=1 Tax=Pseudomonas delhiensis TaxID=366289 RepID=A0A239IYU0_9PSED|nr:OmpA family protein [Pseudomonas delhiensis]SDJ73007.1 OmpA family protein [Pseudomonas delhiensis]SNS98946.1 OmpA family protein [Pseudomonas delhiensis]
MQNDFIGQLLEDLCRRFGMAPDNAGKLLGLLAHRVLDEQRGGWDGFVQHLQRQGLGAWLQGWLEGDRSRLLDHAQLEQVFEAGTLGRFARHLGLPDGQLAEAAAGCLPGLLAGIDAAGGQADARAAGLTVLMADTAELLPVLQQAPAPEPAQPRHDGRRLPLTPWLGGVLVLALLTLGLSLRQCSSTPVAQERVAAAVEVAPQPEASVVAEAPRFMFELREGKVRINGQLASIDERASLLGRLKEVFGAEHLRGDIRVKRETAPAAWLDGLLELLPELKVEGLKLGFNGERIRMDSTLLTQAERIELSQKLRETFGGFEFLGLWNRTLAALSGLPPGSGAQQLADALNQLGIRFDNQSITISRDSDEVLAEAAEAIRQAPPGTRVEVGGYTDDSGDSQSSQQASHARAEAVVARLVELGVTPDRLQAKGYGRSQPLFSNATEAGRARNQRIQFSVLE